MCNIITIYNVLFKYISKCNIPKMAELNFQQPFLQALVSHNPSEIIKLIDKTHENIFYKHSMSWLLINYIRQRLFIHG